MRPQRHPELPSALIVERGRGKTCRQFPYTEGEGRLGRRFDPTADKGSGKQERTLDEEQKVPGIHGRIGEIRSHGLIAAAGMPWIELSCRGLWQIAHGLAEQGCFEKGPAFVLPQGKDPGNAAHERVGVLETPLIAASPKQGGEHRFFPGQNGSCVKPGKAALRQLGATALQKGSLAVAENFPFQFFGVARMGRVAKCPEFRPVAYAGDGCPIRCQTGIFRAGYEIDSFPVVSWIEAAAPVPRRDHWCRCVGSEKEVAKLLPVDIGRQNKEPVAPKTAGPFVQLFASDPQNPQSLEIGSQGP